MYVCGPCAWIICVWSIDIYRSYVYGPSIVFLIGGLALCSITVSGLIGRIGTGKKIRSCNVHVNIDCIFSTVIEKQLEHAQRYLLLK